MRILMLHNHYVLKGGEDVSCAMEEAVLRAHGHEVVSYRRSNRELETVGRLKAGADLLWSRRTYADIAALTAARRFDVMHVQNFFPRISPSAHHAARAAGVPVVQHLRNFRLICPGSLLLRDGRVCEDCLGRSVPWPGVLHGCYRASRVETAGVAAMAALHGALGTWRRAVDLFVAPSELVKRKFVQAGWDPDRLFVKPNFVHPDPGAGPGDGGFALYVGRLSPEKGVGTLLRAWARIGDRLPLKVAGIGPLENDLRRDIPDGVTMLGEISYEDVLDLLGRAAVTIFPSEWYETFGRVVVEGFAKGTPVIASDVGTATELVTEGRTGLFFRSGDAESLVSAVERFLSPETDRVAMRRAARAAYLDRYSGEANYRMLRALYDRAREIAAARPVRQAGVLSGDRPTR